MKSPNQIGQLMLELLPSRAHPIPIVTIVFERNSYEDHLSRFQIIHGGQNLASGSVLIPSGAIRHLSLNKKAPYELLEKYIHTLRAYGGR